MYDECSLPGFLTLDLRSDGEIVSAQRLYQTAHTSTGNAVVGITFRKGFLSYLGALTKLEVLQGSFHLNRDSLSDAEIDWIKERGQKSVCWNSIRLVTSLYHEWLP